MSKIKTEEERARTQQNFNEKPDWSAYSVAHTQCWLAQSVCACEVDIYSVYTLFDFWFHLFIYISVVVVVLSISFHLLFTRINSFINAFFRSRSIAWFIIENEKKNVAYIEGKASALARRNEIADTLRVISHFDKCIGIFCSFSLSRFFGLQVPLDRFARSRYELMQEISLNAIWMNKLSTIFLKCSMLQRTLQSARLLDIF